MDQDGSYVYRGDPSRGIITWYIKWVLGSQCRDKYTYKNIFATYLKGNSIYKNNKTNTLSYTMIRLVYFMNKLPALCTSHLLHEGGDYTLPKIAQRLTARQKSCVSGYFKSRQYIMPRLKDNIF
jgi:hypothetical protein